MKIAMLGHKRMPSREGGVEIVVEELSTRMVKYGHEVVCYNRRGKHVGDRKVKQKKIKEYNGVKIKTAFTLDIKGVAAMTSSFFAAIYTTFRKFDVVHFHAEGPAAMCWLPKLFGKKVIVTVHGLDWQREKWGGFATKYLLFGERMAVKHADEIIVLSENVKKYFKDTYNRETVFIPNGTNKHNRIEADIIKNKWNLEQNEYILFLGRIVPEKGVGYLVDAFSKLKTDKKLVIAGGSSDTDSFYTSIYQKVKDNRNVVFTNFVQGKELEELYSNAFIYVLPSDLEGMPIGLLEAMSYGNCCVVSDIPECTEAVGDMAVHFKKGDTEDLQGKLQWLCDNGDVVEKYRENSSEYICKRYSWDDVVDRTLKIYGE